MPDSNVESPFVWSSVVDMSSNTGFLAALVSSFSMIAVSEIGDKTFFIAALMSMKHSHTAVFLGAFSALGLMTLFSAFAGAALPQLIDRKYTTIISIILFAFFGFKMIYAGLHMENAESEELHEVEESLKEKSSEALCDVKGSSDAGLEFPTISKPLWIRKRFLRSFFVKVNLTLNKFLNRVFLQAFYLTFIAEWGDRSQIATMALAASKNVWGIALGGTIGHGMCTGIAVIGGRMLASQISERVVTLSGGLLFLIFALVTFFFET